MRRAYVCPKCYELKIPYRIFLRPGEPKPKCPKHGPMVRQPNRPHRTA